jgi:hypothetical protein
MSRKQCSVDAQAQIAATITPTPSSYSDPQLFEEEKGKDFQNGYGISRDPRK